jgi:uncharacterized membrane protein (UPF0127 family)
MDPSTLLESSGLEDVCAARYGPAMQRAVLGPFWVSLPRTRRERTRGLRGREALGPNEGLLLQRCRSVHTLGMRFPIDAVLLDDEEQIVRVVRMAPRRLLLPRVRVRHVLEVAAGVAPPVGSRLRLSPADLSPHGPDGPRPRSGAPARRYTASAAQQEAGPGPHRLEA